MAVGHTWVAHGSEQPHSDPHQALAPLVSSTQGGLFAVPVSKSEGAPFLNPRSNKSPPPLVYWVEGFRFVAWRRWLPTC